VKSDAFIEYMHMVLCLIILLNVLWYLGNCSRHSCHGNHII